MSHTIDIYQLLVKREGQWVSRDDLNFLGGEDTGRRMREVRRMVEHSGQYRLDERTDSAKRLEFRLRRTETSTDAEAEKWRCVECGSTPPPNLLQPSVDPRWAFAPCGPCKNRRATYKRVRPMEVPA